MDVHNVKQLGIGVLAGVGAAFLFLWSVPSSVDFLLRMRHGRSAPHTHDQILPDEVPSIRLRGLL